MSPNLSLNFFDIFIILFFLGLFLIIPHFLVQKQDTSSDVNFILMGRGLTLPLLVATLTSSWYGGIFGVTQIAFEQGIYSFFTQGLFWYVAYFIFALFLAKKIRSQNILSLPELIGQKFGPRARTISAIFLFFHALPITYALSIGLVINLFFNIGFFGALLLGLAIVTSYSYFGGFKAVVLTDCLQFVLMFGAVIILILFLYFNFGGLEFLVQKLPKSYFSWHGNYSLLSALQWLFLACSTTLIHPVFYQRCLAAKDQKTAIWGILCAMIFWLIFDLCTTLGGMYAKAIIPEAPSELAYLLLGNKILPSGLRGLFFAGIIATILSTIDSFLFVSGTAISYDLKKHIKLKLKNYHQIGILLSAICVIIFASFFKFNFEALWRFKESFFSVALLTPVLISLLTKKNNISQIKFFAPVITSLVIFIIGYIIKYYLKINLYYFYFAHMFSWLSFLFVSYLHAQRKTKISKFSNI